MSSSEQISAALGRVDLPVFLARQEAIRGRSILGIHTAAGFRAQAVRNKVSEEFERERIDLPFRIITHRKTSLRNKRSVESLSRSFGTGDIIYDPTGIVRRSSAILDLCGRLRLHFGARLDGVYLDSTGRTLFAIFDKQQFPGDPGKLLAERVRAMRAITLVVNLWRSEQRLAFDVAIKLGFDLPVGVGLTPIDKLSASRMIGNRLRSSFRRNGLASALAAMLGIGVAGQANAADLWNPPPQASDLFAAPGSTEPAVTAPNLALLLRGAWLSGGLFDDDAWGGLGVKGTIPVGHQFGAQIDAAIGTHDYFGVGGHLFWRDPAIGLVGLIASHESIGGNHLTRYGLEGERFFPNLTLRAVVGGEKKNSQSSAMAELDVTFYANPNLALSGGAEFHEGGTVGKVGVEWQPAFTGMSGLSLYGNAEFGYDGYARAMAGINYHFGINGATLKDRDRHYDPAFLLWNQYLSPH